MCIWTQAGYMRICVYLLARNAARRSHGLTQMRATTSGLLTESSFHARSGLADATTTTSALRRRRRAAFFLFSTRRCLLCIWAYLCVSDAISLRISHQGSRSGVGRAVRGRKTQINADAALIRLFTSNKDSGTRRSAVHATVRSGSVS